MLRSLLSLLFWVKGLKLMGRHGATDKSLANKTTTTSSMISLTYLGKTTVRNYMINGTRTVYIWETKMKICYKGLTKYSLLLGAE